MLFKHLQDGHAITYCNGIYKQADLYTWNGGLYLKYGSGYARILRNNATSKPRLTLKSVILPGENQELQFKMGRAIYKEE